MFEKSVRSMPEWLMRLIGESERGREWLNERLEDRTVKESGYRREVVVSPPKALRDEE